MVKICKEYLHLLEDDVLKNIIRIEKTWELSCASLKYRNTWVILATKSGNETVSTADHYTLYGYQSRLWSVSWLSCDRKLRTTSSLFLNLKAIMTTQYLTWCLQREPNTFYNISTSCMFVFRLLSLPCLQYEIWRKAVTDKAYYYAWE